MFEAKLKSRSQPELGALAVTFPIPEERYETMIFALQDLKIGDVKKQDCCIESIRAPDCPALNRMTGTMANVDELDWLGKQLESFDRYELLQFNAAVERFGLSAADELIDLSFCAREVTVVSDFNDLELVGKRHYLTVHGACDSEELEDLDGKETALALISGQPGYVTRYGVVYDNGMKLEQAYDRKHLPPIWMPENCIMELKLRATGEDDPKKQEWVQLPASRIKLERAMLRAGIASCGEMQMLVSDSRFPDEVDCTLDVEHGSLFELNRLCQIIPPKPDLQQTTTVTKQLRVAAYCRVSTKEEEQASSYEAQCEYYTDKIMSNKEWTMAGIFADEGITGTSTKKRTEFLRMIRQCKQKKIDLVLTKSIQRFARNTLDCINYTRILRQLGIGVLFEKENINSLPPDSEFMITMYGAMAQSESESISGNIRRGRQMHAKVGTLKVPCYRLYGYEKDADGKFRVIPEQAEIVRELYKRYESGASLRNLQDWLEENQIKTVLGESKWTTTSIKSILTNEKYCGDVLLMPSRNHA